MPLNYIDENKSKNQPLSSSLFSQMQIDILTSKLRSGEKLTEKRISDEYKVSRTPVREALRQLEVEGLITNIPNRGAFVSGLTKQDISDLYVLRKANEIQAVRWGIERITDDEMEKMEETFEFMEFYTMKNDINKMQSINSTFHQIIYMSSHNKMLLKLLTSYQNYLKYCTKIDTYEETYLAKLFKEHKAIFDAFKNKDVMAGAQAMEVHMDNSRIRKIGF